MAPLHGWRRFWLFLGLFFAAFILAAMIPTPGAWSDIRSQWAGLGAVALIATIFLFLVQWDYWRRGLLNCLQVCLLSAVFAAVLAVVGLLLWEGITFLRSNGHDATARRPNKTLHANPRPPSRIRAHSFVGRWLRCQGPVSTAVGEP